ncbi:MAG: hypothetical protein ACRDRA_13000 [Pseudonocardiaceae bacterium]
MHPAAADAIKHRHQHVEIVGDPILLGQHRPGDARLVTLAAQSADQVALGRLSGQPGIDVVIKQRDLLLAHPPQVLRGDAQLVGDTAVAGQGRAEGSASGGDTVEGDGGLADPLDVQITAAHVQVAGGDNDVEFGVVLALQQRHHVTQTGVTAGQHRFQCGHRGGSPSTVGGGAARRAGAGCGVSPPVGGARLGRTTEGGPVGAPRSPDRRGPVAEDRQHRGDRGDGDRITRVGRAGEASSAAAAVVQSAQPPLTRDTPHQGSHRRPGDAHRAHAWRSVSLASAIGYGCARDTSSGRR